MESHVLGPKTSPERWAGYQTNIPPTTSCLSVGFISLFTFALEPLLASRWDWIIVGVILMLSIMIP